MVHDNERKMKLLVIYDYLCRMTDENHALNTDEIIAELANHNIKVTRKVLATDIALLNEHGYEVLSYKKKYNYYYVVSRHFDTAEISMLADVVKASKLSSGQKSSLIKKLSEMVGIHQAEVLSRYIINCDTPKRSNSHIIYSIDAIDRTINEGKKISFRYYSLDEKKNKIAKNELSRLLAAQTRTVKDLSALKDELVKSLIGESRFDSSMLQELLAKKELEVKSSTEQIENKERELDGLTSSRNSVFELNSKMQSWDTDFEDQSVDGQKVMLYQVVDRIDIYRDRVEIHVNIKMDMYENGLSDRLQAPTSELITVPARIEDNDNLPMVACGTDQTVLSGQSIIGGVNSVSLAVLRA